MVLKERSTLVETRSWNQNIVWIPKNISVKIRIWKVIQTEVTAYHSFIKYYQNINKIEPDHYNLRGNADVCI